jgi:hypothetical protein
MTFLSEDPTYLAGSLVLLAGALLMALKLTQQGRYLMWALTALGLALAVVVVEQLWVTDNERIEHTVYELRRAVLAADPEQVLAQLTPDVEYVQDGISLSGDATRELIRGHLASAAFDFVHIQDLQTSAGRQTRRGKAEFRVYAKGTVRTLLATYNMGTASSTWSLGFQETELGVWKVNRITPVSAPDVTVWLPKSQGSSRSVGRGPGGMNPRGLESLGSPRIRSSSGRYRGRPSPPDPFPNNRAEAPR